MWRRDRRGREKMSWRRDERKTDGREVGEKKGGERENEER